MDINGLKNYLEIEKKTRNRIKDLESELKGIQKEKDFENILDQEFPKSEALKELDMIWNKHDCNIRLIKSYIEVLKKQLVQTKRKICKG